MNRNNLKNNITITIPTDNEVFRAGMVSPTSHTSHTSPTSPPNRVTPIPSVFSPPTLTETTTSPHVNYKRNTPAVITAPASPMALNNPSPSSHFTPTYPHTVNPNPLSHFTSAPHLSMHSTSAVNPLALTMGKYITNSETHGVNDTPIKPMSSLSSRSSTGSSIRNSSSEGHIDLLQNMSNNSSGILRSSGGITKDMAHERMVCTSLTILVSRGLRSLAFFMAHILFNLFLSIFVYFFFLSFSPRNL
jgi:hypothetical protein